MARGSRITPDQRKQILDMHRKGWTIKAIYEKVGLSRSTVSGVIAGLKTSSGNDWRERDTQYTGPIPPEELKPEARQALGDIGHFAFRYFGLILMPYQIEATEEVTGLLATPEEEYAVINQPPGTGKSTFFTLVLPAWVTCNDRTIRGMIGSASQGTAQLYTGRLRTSFVRRQPVKAKPRDLDLGIAVDAEATLVEDYGRFRPLSDEVWRADAFTVMQHGGIELSEKEPTWSAYGRESTFIGLRPDLAVWDDVYDPRKMRTAEARADLKEWWTEYAETRLEPGGLLILQGQRLGPDDIYRYALNQAAGEPDEDDDDFTGEVPDVDDETPRKYHHIKFRAHYDDRCVGAAGHKRDSAPYPEGCVLYPKRLGWRKLKTIQANSSEKYAVVYQQDDVDPASVLVPMAWITGGRDPDSGEQLVGCWDRDRGLCELPRDHEGRINLVGPLLSVATADPSPTRFWSIQWWVVDIASKQRFLMDHYRHRMEAPDFLDRLHPSGEYVGVMEEWQKRSVSLGLPIRWWVVEINAAQRFMLQYQHTKDWQRLRGVAIVPHETMRNKSDPKLGIESIAPAYHYGRVRFPGKGPLGRAAAQQIIQEVTHYPEWPTDDTVLAHWFLEWNLPRLERLVRRNAEPKREKRPSWLTPVPA